jgi:hypothetical protein
MNRIALLPSLASLAISGSLALGIAPASAAAMASAVTVVIPSVTSVDVERHRVTFPLHSGTSNGTAVWYVLTDASDAGEAKARGLVFAPALAGVGTTQAVTANGDTWQFAAVPDFAPARVFTPGATGFPPSAATPGATASDAYSPFVRVDGASTVFNAPIVAVGDGPFDVMHHTNTADRVLAIDPAKKTVTLLLADGFADGKRIFYISTEASDAGAATIERATYVPGLAQSAKSARLPIYVIANGPTGQANPLAQGLGFVALDGGLASDATLANSVRLLTSRNVLSSAPATAPDGSARYSPLWDVNVGMWTATAVDAHRVTQLTSVQAVASAVSAGDLTGPGGAAFGPVGFAVNCPVVAVTR